MLLVQPRSVFASRAGPFHLPRGLRHEQASPAGDQPLLPAFTLHKPLVAAKLSRMGKASPTLLLGQRSFVGEAEPLKERAQHAVESTD